MKTLSIECAAFSFRCRPADPGLLHSTNRGQALVEFTLVFLLLLVVAWIPSDFGLAFFTGQLAQNAAREGARIAAADPNYAAQVGNCTLPGCYSLTDGTVLRETAERLSAALLPSATISLNSDTSGGTCNTKVIVQVSGNYNFFFYQLLRMMGANVPNATQIVRQTAMRWEHQC